MAKTQESWYDLKQCVMNCELTLIKKTPITIALLTSKLEVRASKLNAAEKCSRLN